MRDHCESTLSNPNQLSHLSYLGRISSHTEYRVSRQIGDTIIVVFIILYLYSNVLSISSRGNRGDAFDLTLFPVMGELWKRNFFPCRFAFGECIFARRNKISTITYVCARQERQTLRWDTCAKFRQVDSTIPAPRAEAWRGEGNYCNRAIILSASLKDRANRNAGRL